MTNALLDHIEFIGRLTGAPVSEEIVKHFTEPAPNGHYRVWSEQDIERLHLLSIAAKRHTSQMISTPSL